MKLKTIGKGIDIYPSYEGGEYFVEGAKNAQEALEVLELNEEQEKGRWTAKDAELVQMSMCLDCEMWWILGDGVCGECGEDRLSKKYKECFFFN